MKAREMATVTCRAREGCVVVKAHASAAMALEFRYCEDITALALR